LSESSLKVEGVECFLEVVSVQSSVAFVEPLSVLHLLANLDVVCQQKRVAVQRIVGQLLLREVLPNGLHHPAEGMVEPHFRAVDLGAGQLALSYSFASSFALKKVQYS